MPSRVSPRREPHRRGAAPSGRPLQDLLDQRQALLDLADADPDAGIDVALRRAPARRSERVVGRIGRASARVEGAARGAADIAAGAELPRELGLQDAGGDGAVLQRGGVVVELDQLAESGAGSFVEQRAQRGRRRRRARSAATPPGTMRSIISRWPKQASRGAQHALAQDAAMGVHEREGGVVADRADIAEMVGDALELGHQRAQPDARAAAPRRRAPPRPRARRRAHRRPCCRRRCGRQARAARSSDRARHQRLDALVHIAEPLLQPHHGLAVGGEAEMARAR